MTFWLACFCDVKLTASEIFLTQNHFDSSKLFNFLLADQLHWPMGSHGINIFYPFPIFSNNNSGFFYINRACIALVFSSNTDLAGHSIMANFYLSLFLFFALFLGHGVVELQASHHVYRNLQTSQSTSPNQPYRTGYHFQPPKNWINGNSFSFFPLFLNSSFLPYIS